MKKPRRREAAYTLKELAEAWRAIWGNRTWGPDDEMATYFKVELRRIAARKQKGKK